MNRKLEKIISPDFPVYLIIMAVCAGIAAYFKQYYLAGALLAAAVASLIYALLHITDRKRRIKKYIQASVNRMVIAQDSESPLPKVMFDTDTLEVIWASERFLSLLGRNEPYIGTRLNELLPDFNTAFLQGNSSKNMTEFSLNGKRYHVFGNTLSKPEEESPVRLSTLLFVDMTAWIKVRDEYAQSRPVVCVILVDNYDELSKNQSDNDMSVLNVAINNTVMGWTNGCGGLLRKLERNRYLFVFESRYLQPMIDRKFSLLEDIRKVVNNAGIQATLSIGIGKDGSGYEESFSFAQLGVEMALSRGGDQVVIKDRYNFSFYSGRGKEGGTRTKVKSRVMAGSLSELIAQSSQVFIMGHANADFDALGAAVGVAVICRKKQTPAKIVLDVHRNAVQSLLTLLRQMEQYKDCFISGEDAMVQADSKSLLVVVDTNRPDQVQDKALLDSISRIAVIDHHRRAADYIENVVLNLHEPSASSASELVADLVQYAVEPTDVLPEEAIALLSGIVLDTKQFSVRTGGKTFEAAAFLQRLGADPTEVKKLLQNDFNTTIKRYDLVQRAKLYRREIAISVCDASVDRVTAAQAADELINISDVATSFVVFPADGKICISARSIGDANVQLILEPLGGGGNPATAGAQIPGTDIRTVVEQLVLSIDQFYDTAEERRLSSAQA